MECNTAWSNLGRRAAPVSAAQMESVIDEIKLAGLTQLTFLMAIVPVLHAVALAAVLARGGTAGPYALARLENPDGYVGVDGIFRLRETGAVEREFAVLEVRRDAPRVIDRALTSFSAPTTY